MFRRLSKVNTVYVNSISFSSTLEIGDSKYITPVMRALAVKREFPLFFSNEGNFNEHSVFTRPIPLVPTEEVFNMTVLNEAPAINVNSIRVTGVSSSSVVHIGSTNLINAESRIKHIRQLLRQPGDVPSVIQGPSEDIISPEEEIDQPIESTEEGGS